MSNLEQCLIHLDNNEGVLDRRTKQQIFNEIMAMKKQDADITLEELEREIQNKISDGISKVDKFVHDSIKIKKDQEELFIDRVTGKKLTDLRKVMRQQRDKLVGRNGVDTQVRKLRNRLVNDFDSMEKRFKTHENKTYKSLRDIKPGSDEERYIFNKVASMTEELHPEKLTDEVIAGMLKGSNELDRIAFAMVSYNSHARAMANSYGMSIKFNKNYVMKRRYDMGAIDRKFGTDPDKAAELFADYMVERLNISESIGKRTTRETAREKMKELYKELKTNAGKRTAADSDKEFNTDRANSISRKIVFKDNDAAYEAFRDLSMGGLRDQFDRNAKSLASRMVQVDNFGYDAKRVANEVFEHREKVLGKQHGWTERYYGYQILQARKELVGQQSYGQTALTDYTNAAKFAVGATKLHKAIVSAMMDMIETNRQVFYTDGSYFGGLVEWGNTFRKLFPGESIGGWTMEQRQELANDLGIVFNYFSSGEGMRMAQGDLQTTGSKLGEFISSKGATIMNWTTLLPHQTGVSKLASGLVGAGKISSIVDNYAAGKYSGRQLKFVKDTMATYKISDAEMKLLAKVDKVTTWGSPILTGKAIRDSLEKIGMETVAKELNIEPDKVASAWIDLADKVENYQNDFNVRGTPTPELATKVSVPGRTSDDEKVRVLSSIMSQFMDTPIAQAQNFLEIVDKIKRVNDSDSIWNQGVMKDLAPFAVLNGIMSVSAYLAFEQAYCYIFNTESLIDKMRSGDEEEQSKAMWRALDRSSPIPFVVQALELQFSDRYNETALDTFSSGPVTGLLKDTLTVMKPTGNGWEKDLGTFAKKQGPQRTIIPKLINNWVSDEKL